MTVLMSRFSPKYAQDQKILHLYAYIAELQTADRVAYIIYKNKQYYKKICDKCLTKK